MVKYFCEKCGKSFPTPSKLKRHNERKTPCISVVVEKNLLEPTRTYQNLPEPTRTYQNLLEPTGTSQITNTKTKTKKINEEDDNGYYNCEYCNKKLRFKKNYTKHLRTGCKEIPLAKRKLLLEKYNKNKKHLNALVKVSQPLAITNNNTTNNIQNNNTTNNNIQNNNQKLTIKINPLGKEDISSICEKKIIEFLGDGTRGFVNFLSSIYKIDENKNLYIKSKKENIVQFINKDYELDIGDLNEIISDITLSHYNIFEDLFELHQDKISKVNKSKFERSNLSYNKNPERFERKAYLNLVNINNINKKYIDKFLKIKNKDGEEQVLIGRL